MHNKPFGKCAVSLLMTVVVLLVMLLPTVAAQGVTAVQGDMNGDGKVSIADAVRVYYFVLGSSPLTEYQQALAEANSDGKINITDAIYWYYLVNGRVTASSTTASTSTTTDTQNTDANGTTTATDDITSLTTVTDLQTSVTSSETTTVTDPIASSADETTVTDLQTSVTSSETTTVTDPIASSADETTVTDLQTSVTSSETTTVTDPTVSSADETTVTDLQTSVTSSETTTVTDPTVSVVTTTTTVTSTAATTTTTTTTITTTTTTTTTTTVITTTTTTTRPTATTTTGPTTTTTTTTTATCPADTLTPLDPDLYYGRQLLVAEGDTDKVALYDYLDEQVKKLNTNIELYQFSTPLVEFQRVLQYYYDDHPETYWLSRGYSYMYYDQGGVRYVYSMGQNYAYTASQIAQYQKQLDARAAELLEGITDAMPQVQREQLVHDRLITSSKYDLSLSADHTHDLIGVMLNGTGVCESYSRAFQYLMYRCGIPVALVTGVTESGESHMWNAVKIDGNWYQVDVTWDDPVFDDPKPDYIEYTYFNLTDTEMFSVRTKTVTYSQTNSSYQISYPTPPCTATAASYVKMNVVELSSFDAALIGETIAQSVKNNSMAVFKPIGQYTMAQLKADVGTSAKYWLIVSVANEHLGSAQQLTNPGYILKENTYHNALLVWMRNV